MKTKILLMFVVLVLVVDTINAALCDIAIGTDKAWHIRHGADLSYAAVKDRPYITLTATSRDNGANKPADVYFGETDGTTGYLSRRNGDNLDWLASDTFGTAVTALAVLPNGNIVMGATVNGVGKLYIRNGNDLSAIASDTGYGIINDIAITSDGHIAVGCANGEWHLRNGSDLSFLGVKTGMNNTLSVVALPGNRLAFGQTDGTTGTLSIRKADSTLSWIATDTFGSAVRALAVLPNGNLVVGADYGTGGKLYIRNGTTLAGIASDEGYAVINDIVITASGDIAVGCANGYVHLRSGLDLSYLGIDDGYGNIGAMAVLLDYCINPPSMDTDGNCKIDFLDFAEFAAQWMECGLENQADCWE